MEDLKIFSKKFIKNITESSLRQKNCGMNIDSLTIWLPI